MPDFRTVCAGPRAEGAAARVRRRVGLLVSVMAALLVSASLIAGSARAASAPGTITNYTDPSMEVPTGIVAGPDGALWFTNAEASSIGRITTAGAVTNFPGAGIDDPQGIAGGVAGSSTAGPNGSLWFVNYYNNSIGEITTSGAVTNYTAPSISGPWGITVGPDGA